MAPIVFCLALVACEQPPPPGSDDGTSDADDADDTTNTDTTDTGDTDTGTTDTGTTDSETTEADSSSETTGPLVGADTFYPLADGATWTYIAKTTQGQVLSMEMVEVVDTVWDGEPAFLQSDSPGPSGNWTESVLVRDGDLVKRVYKEEFDAMGLFAKVSYVPGFVRTNDAWDTVNFFEEFEYVRTETDANGFNEDIEDRGHSYKVLAINEPVTVPAGTFDCIAIERIRTVGATAGDRVLFWYALGVGKVREERPADSKIEELAAVDIPGGASYP